MAKNKNRSKKIKQSTKIYNLTLVPIQHCIQSCNQTLVPINLDEERAAEEACNANVQSLCLVCGVRDGERAAEDACHAAEEACSANIHVERAAEDACRAAEEACSANIHVEREARAMTMRTRAPM